MPSGDWNKTASRKFHQRLSRHIENCEECEWYSWLTYFSAYTIYISLLRMSTAMFNIFICFRFFAHSDLSNNQIKKVAADAFHGLKSLESLYVSFSLYWYILNNTFYSILNNILFYLTTTTKIYLVAEFYMATKSLNYQLVFSKALQICNYCE